MTETLMWTIVFFGGDLLVVLGLILVAVRKDLKKSREGSPTAE